MRNPWPAEHRRRSAGCGSEFCISLLDDSVVEELRVRVSRNGRSLEAEMRAILTATVRDDDSTLGLFSALIERFAELSGAASSLTCRPGQPPPELPTRSP